MAFIVDMVILGCGWAIVDLLLQTITDPSGSAGDSTWVLLLAPFVFLGIPCWPLWASSFRQPTNADEAFGLLLFLLSLLSILLKDGFRGQSPGKRWLGLRVMDRETLQPASFGGSIKRNLALLLPFFVGYVAIGLTLRRRGRFGEKWAGTMVIEDRFRDNPVFTGGHRRCRACGYDLTGNQSGRCPECGTERLSLAPSKDARTHGPTGA